MHVTSGERYTARADVVATYVCSPELSWPLITTALILVHKFGPHWSKNSLASHWSKYSLASHSTHNHMLCGWTGLLENQVLFQFTCGIGNSKLTRDWFSKSNNSICLLRLVPHTVQHSPGGASLSGGWSHTLVSSCAHTSVWGHPQGRKTWWAQVE